MKKIFCFAPNSQIPMCKKVKERKGKGEGETKKKKAGKG
jgi:hypothetical protein